MSEKKLPVVILLVALVAAGAVLFLTRHASRKNVPVSAPKAKPPAVTTLGSLISPAEPGQKTVELTVTAEGGKFSLSTLAVPVGARVLLTFVNLGSGYHNLTLMGQYLQTATPTIAPSQQFVLAFTPSNAETITYYCSINDHEKLGEKGTLVVQ